MEEKSVISFKEAISKGTEIIFNDVVARGSVIYDTLNITYNIRGDTPNICHETIRNLITNKLYYFTAYIIYIHDISLSTICSIIEMCRLR